MSVFLNILISFFYLFLLYVSMFIKFHMCKYYNLLINCIYFKIVNKQWGYYVINFPLLDYHGQQNSQS